MANNKYIVYRGDSLRPHNYLIACFDTKEDAIEFASLKYSIYSKNKNKLDWAREQFKRLYKDNTHRVGLDYMCSEDYIYYQHIGIEEVNYYDTKEILERFK